MSRLPLQFNKINSCLNFGLNQMHVHSTVNKTFVRHLRRSRYGKDHNQEELKYQRLLRTFKYGSKPLEPENFVKEPIELSSAENEHLGISESVTESSLEYNSDKESVSLVTPEDLLKKFEEKFTPLRSLTYSDQLARKYKRSMGIFRLLGRKLKLLNVPIAMGEDRLPCPVGLVIPSPELEAYRNKDDFNIGLGLDGNEKTVGFFLDTPTEFSTPFCIAPNELPIIKESHKKFAEDFQNYIRMSPLPASQHFSDRGYWKNLIVRSNKAGHLMGIVVIHPQDLSENEIQLEKEKLRDYFSCISQSSYNLQSLYFQTCIHSRCSHEQSPFELLLGNSFITEEINNMAIHISPDSFFHVNSNATESMYNSLLKLCRVNKSTTVLDISCGVGAVSCLFSPRVKHCIGIDDSIQAVNDARRNALENRIENADFIYGRPENFIKDILSKDYFHDVLVILNSSHCTITKAVISSLREFKNIDKIVYIANKTQAAVDNIVQLCKPCGSARNLGKAFLPLYAVPVDFGPQTDQFGVVVMLQRLSH